MTASKLTVLESLDLSDFKSVFISLVRCLDPDLKCLDPDSFNVRRGSQTLSANLNAIILFASYDFFFNENKAESMAIQKGMNLEIWTSNKE